MDRRLAHREAHPLAQRVFETLRGASDDDRRAVYEVLRERLRVAQPEIVLEIAEALRACARDLGVAEALVPAAGYVEWRRSASNGRVPSRERITRLGDGSWTRGRAIALGLPVADPAYRRMLTVGKRYTREAKLDALRRFVADLPEDVRPSPWRYKPWAASVDRSVACAAGVPLAPVTIAREFGSWSAALDAAGIEVRVVPGRAIPVAGWSTREDAVRALLTAVEELEFPLTMPAYDAWAHAQHAASAPEDASEGRPSGFPLSSSIARRFGGWRAAVRKVAGPDVPVGRGHTAEYSNDELTRTWTDFLRYADGLATERRWRQYREHVFAGSGTYVVPCAGTMMRRLGGGLWSGIRAHFDPDAGGKKRFQLRWSERELTRAWRSCATALGAAPKSFTEYDNWRQQQRTQLSPATAVPPSGPTLMRRLEAGSWRELFEQVEGRAPDCRKRESYSDGELRAAWLDAQRCLGRPPSIAGYRRYRAQRFADHPTIPLPAVNTLMRRFGTWSALCRAVGGESPSHGVRWTEPELIEIVRRCAAELGRRPSIKAYELWRRSTTGGGSAGRIPTTVTICERLGQGRWAAAVIRALDDTSGEGASA